MEPAPVGVAGELYIGGDGLARGYVNSPELTAEKFVPDPFGEGEGRRLYRSGDLVSYGPGGELELVGRIDHQVKIRGYRIELGEVEAVLKGHPSVKEAVVLAREDEPGEKRLVAYVAPEVERDEGVEIACAWIAELRSYVRDRLPEYMTPAAIVELERLPLTANGKVDRNALPAPVMTDRIKPIQIR
jgi:acyl-CoA synthetase (AMP-forming)/AMP-acid ligase II